MTQPHMTGTDISTFDNDERIEATHANMVAAGVAVETRQIVDYWSFAGTEKFYLPGQEGVAQENKQYIVFKRMVESDKVEFQTKTNRDIRVQNTTKDIKLNMNPALERKVLIDISVTNWYLYKQNHKGELVEITYNPKDRAEFFRIADPKLVQDLEAAIRKANPWMRAELGADEIRAEIAQLSEQLAEAEAREDAK